MRKRRMAAIGSWTMATSKQMSEGKRAYEARRAARAGLSLDKWLAAKERDRLAEEKAKARAIEAVTPAKPPGVFRGLRDRPPKPLGSRHIIAAHADWSIDPRKRWAAIAHEDGSGWRMG